MNLAEVVRDAIDTIKEKLEGLEAIHEVLSQLVGAAGQPESADDVIDVQAAPRRRGPGRPRGFGRPRKPKSTVPKGTRQQHGTYMGLLTGLRPRQKSQVKKIRNTEGPDAAIKAAMVFREQNEGPK